MKQLIYKPAAFALQLLRLHYLYLKISIKYLNVYKTSAILSITFSLIFLIAEVLTVNIYYTFSEHIGDWDKGSFYLLLGTFNTITCLYTYFFEIPHDDFLFKMRYKELGFDLLRPIDSLAYTSIQRVDLISLLNLPIPLWLLLQGFYTLNLQISPSSILLYSSLIVIGVLLVYLINQCFLNFSFWVIDASNIIAAADQIVQLGSRPGQVYPKLIQLGASYLIPIVLCTNLSVKTLKQDFQWTPLLLLLLTTGLFFLFVRLQWKWGLRRYMNSV